MKKPTKKEVFNIPNIMCYVRIALIPVFCYMYLTAETEGQYLASFAVMAVSALTDLFDGMIARKFNMVSELGKVLDPVADKLNHAALAVCLALRYPFMWALIALMVVKEGYMAYMGIKFLKKDEMMDGAMWFGKVCTATMFIGLIALILMYNISLKWANIIIGIMMAVMVFTLCKYIVFYRNFDREKKA